MTGSVKSRLLLAIFAGSVICGIAAWADPPSQVGRLSLISGSVSFLPGSLDEWTPATLNYPLTTGDHLWTDTGARAEVRVLSAAIRLSSRTEFSFLSLDDETVRIRVSEGSLSVSLRSVDDGTTFEIDTPNATVSLRSERPASVVTIVNLATLKTRTLPDADRLLSEARKVAGIRIDLNAVSGQLAAAKESLTGAERDMAGGKEEAGRGARCTRLLSLRIATADNRKGETV